MTVTEEIRRAAAGIARRQGLSLVVLFGSAAEGTERPDSDVDIGVRFRGDYDLSKTLEVQLAVSALSGGREVDLAVLNRADPLLMKKIAERCLVLYEDPGAAAAFRLLAFRRYQDHRRFLAMERDFAAAYVKRIAS
ncbi:MAG: nucleotidyltransferase domain-containing protein [Deltaproteobacteria bacterium]|nr:nucleotidyltransferase domain-containing protein [Deltaproteobacteria bacterium]